MAKTLKPPQDRFWPKVRQVDECWVWHGAIARGYGYFGVEPSRTTMAHRWAYEYMVGPIPSGLVIDHLCRNKACVNPAHLEPVPQAVNVRRGDAPRLLAERRGGITHCLRGHALDGDNVRVDKRGRRSCKACHRVADRERKRRYREAAA